MLSTSITLLMITTLATFSNAYLYDTNADAPVDKTQKTHKTKTDFSDGRCGCMLGPPGAPGMPGQNGVPGYHGIRGENGLNGEKGYKGDAGQPGTPGRDGKTGALGPAGTRGRRGEKGEQGPSGVPGPIGMRGTKGYDGIPGIKGSKGEGCPVQRKLAFSVALSQKRGPFMQDTTVMYDNIFVNIGGGFDLTKSHFVSKANGTFLFTAHVLGENNFDVYAWIMLNDKHKVPLHADSRAGYGTGSQTVLLNLKYDDQVWVQLTKGSVVLNDYTTFTGHLLYEDDVDTGGSDEISNHIDTNNYDYWRWRR